MKFTTILCYYRFIPKFGRYGLLLSFPTLLATFNGIIRPFRTMAIF